MGSASQEMGREAEWKVSLLEARVVAGSLHSHLGSLLCPWSHLLSS